MAMINVFYSSLFISCCLIWTYKYVACLPDNCQPVPLDSQYFNKKMEGYVIESKTVVSYSACVYECLVTTDCLSYNFYPDENWCEMNSKNSSMSPESIVAATGKVRYSDISVWPKTLALKCERVDCPSGYRCYQGGNNDNNFTECKHAVVDCGRPKSESKATLSVGNSSLGSVRQYTCWKGYIRNSCDTSKLVTECQPTSQWSRADVHCVHQDNIDACESLFLTDCDSIPDVAFTASTYHIAEALKPHLARLTSPTPENAAWAVQTVDKNQWIQVDMQETKLVKGVITQGRNNHVFKTEQWVSEFEAYYSMDCQTWTPVAGHDGNAKLFSANTDADNTVKALFDFPIRARCLRLHPKTWNDWISMRFDVVGCSIGDE